MDRAGVGRSTESKGGPPIMDEFRPQYSQSSYRGWLKARDKVLAVAHAADVDNATRPVSYAAFTPPGYKYSGGATCIRLLYMSTDTSSKQCSSHIHLYPDTRCSFGRVWTATCIRVV